MQVKRIRISLYWSFKCRSKRYYRKLHLQTFLHESIWIHQHISLWIEKLLPQLIHQQLKSKQYKVIKVVNTKSYDHPANWLYKTNKILKFCDYVKLENYLFVKEVITEKALDMFHDSFGSRGIHQHNNRHFTLHSVNLI